MKPIAITALNVVTVGLALVAYDVIRGDVPPPVPPTEPVDSESAELLARIEALEAERRRPRRVSEIDHGVLARLAALEATAGVPEAPLAPTRDDEVAAAPASAPPRAAGPEADTPPSAAEIARFRKVEAVVREEEIVRKNAARIDRLLDALALNLTEEQRAGVHGRWAAFQPRMGEIWAVAKEDARLTAEAGGQVDRATVVGDTNAVIQSEFAGLLGDLIAPADATSIADALVARGK